MRPFTDILRDMRKGRIVETCGVELAEVVRAVVDTNKPGELTLKLKIKSQGRGDNAVIVSAEIKGKKPIADLPDALFFADLDGDLLQNDPTQNRIFTDVAGDKIDAATGEVLNA